VESRRATGCRPLQMVFQAFNLFPPLSVFDNLTIAPRKAKKRSQEESVSIARHNLEKVDAADREDSYPAHLSGGQQQRVAIARARPWTRT